MPTISNVRILGRSWWWWNPENGIYPPARATEAEHELWIGFRCWR